MKHAVLWGDVPVREGLAFEILEQLAHPVFVKDREFRYVVLNQALASMTGRTREAMFGKTDFDFFSPKEAQHFRRMDEQLFATGEVVHVDDERLTDSKGDEHVLATTKAPLRGPDGTITHVVGIIQDVTWVKRAQDELRLANEGLAEHVMQSARALEAAREALLRKERLAVLGQLSGGLAHQIRNPLGAVLNAASLLKRRLVDSDDATVIEALRVIEEEAWSANRIITDLVDYARVRRGNPVKAPLLTLVEQTLAANAAPSKVDIIRHIRGSSVKVDPLQVVSALGNLVRNAYEAMPSGGTLRVESWEDGAFAVLAVEDTGPGFSPEVESRLFDPLVTTKPLGLGLGLTTARMLIESQSGQLTLAQARPHARLEVRLPRA